MQGSRSRRATAAAAAERLAEMVKQGAERSQAWYLHLKLLDIRDVLRSGDPDEDALRTAAEMLREMYRGPRNFSDFYIPRADPAEQVKENKRFEESVRELRESLSS